MPERRLTSSWQNLSPGGDNAISQHHELLELQEATGRGQRVPRRRAQMASKKPDHAAIVEILVQKRGCNTPQTDGERQALWGNAQAWLFLLGRHRNIIAHRRMQAAKRGSNARARQHAQQRSAPTASIGPNPRHHLHGGSKAGDHIAVVAVLRFSRAQTQTGACSLKAPWLVLTLRQSHL